MVYWRRSNTAIRAFGERGLAGASARGLSIAAGVRAPSPICQDGSKDGLYRAGTFAGFYAHQVVPSVDATFDRPRAECQETA